VRALVNRDGKQFNVPVTEVVPGDIVILSAGDMIPADGRVLEARDFFVKQALLTGESYPVEKRPGELAASATDIQDAANAVFMGTTVTSDAANAFVCTPLGRIGNIRPRYP
jgi:Mg2+-importing ATPase